MIDLRKPATLAGLFNRIARASGSAVRAVQLHGCTAYTVRAPDRADAAREIAGACWAAGMPFAVNAASVTDNGDGTFCAFATV